MLRIAECCESAFNKISRYRTDYEDAATEKLKLPSKRDLRQLKECLQLKFKGDPTLLGSFKIKALIFQDIAPLVSLRWSNSWSKSIWRCGNLISVGSSNVFIFWITNLPKDIKCWKSCITLTSNQHNVHFFPLEGLLFRIYNIPYLFLRFVTRGLQNINIHKRNYLVFFIILAFWG